MYFNRLPAGYGLSCSSKPLLECLIGTGWPCIKCRILESATAEPDAYAVVGVEPDAKAADIKKRYWRLSLLIHPDKCDHPRANDAFQAVSRAAKDLQVFPICYLSTSHYCGQCKSIVSEFFDRADQQVLDCCGLELALLLRRAHRTPGNGAPLMRIVRMRA